MKLTRGIVLSCFLTVLFGACFDDPQGPVVPHIEFERIEFVPATEPGAFDALDLYIRFEDGNGDVGFTLSAADITEPYHSTTFYQENNGKIEPLATEAVSLNGHEYDLLRVTDPHKGKLVVFRTRDNPLYDFLPDGEKCGGSNDLKYYEYLGGKVNADGGGSGRRLLIRAKDRVMLDPHVELVDSFPATRPEYYQIRDYLYFTPNPDHYNIEVDFLVKDPTAPDGSGFREFDWREEYCTTFDGRFPVFADDRSSIEGTLRYSMTSFGLSSVFSIKTLKLRVSIKDRALNRSNVIETPEFTL